MKKLMSYMLSIYGSLKNLHYCVDGPNYYQMHLLADRLIDDINPLEVIDHLNEHMIGCTGKFVSFKEIMNPDEVCGDSAREAIDGCKLLMQKTARYIECFDFKDEDKGLESYLTAVEDNLITSVGFLSKITMKGEY